MTETLADELQRLLDVCDTPDEIAEGGFHGTAEVMRFMPKILTTLREAEGMREALEKHDEAIKGLPCLPGRPLPDICPRCGATSRDGCGPTMAADYIFVEAARLALSQGGGE